MYFYSNQAFRYKVLCLLDVQNINVNLFENTLREFILCTYTTNYHWTEMDSNLLERIEILTNLIQNSNGTNYDSANYTNNFGNTVTYHNNCYRWTQTDSNWGEIVSSVENISFENENRGIEMYYYHYKENKKNGQRIIVRVDLKGFMNKFISHLKDINYIPLLLCTENGTDIYTEEELFKLAKRLGYYV